MTTGFDLIRSSTLEFWDRTLAKKAIDEIRICLVNMMMSTDASGAIGEVWMKKESHTEEIGWKRAPNSYRRRKREWEAICEIWVTRVTAGVGPSPSTHTGHRIFVQSRSLIVSWSCQGCTQENSGLPTWSLNQHLCYIFNACPTVSALPHPHHSISPPLSLYTLMGSYHKIIDAFQHKFHFFNSVHDNRVHSVVVKIYVPIDTTLWEN